VGFPAPSLACGIYVGIALWEWEPNSTQRVCGSSSNIKKWTGHPVEESVKISEDRDNLWINYIHDVANPRIEDG